MSRLQPGSWTLSGAWRRHGKEWIVAIRRYAGKSLISALLAFNVLSVWAAPPASRSTNALNEEQPRVLYIAPWQVPVVRHRDDAARLQSIPFSPRAQTPRELETHRNFRRTLEMKRTPGSFD